MECKCGGQTKDHEAVRSKQIVAKFARCRACGRVHWWFDSRTIEQRMEDRANGETGAD